MGFSSLHVCMESSDHWLQGTIHEESGLDSSSPSGGGGGGDPMLTCSRPLIERRLRPPHDQALKCPRCDSTHTKFCYYNNYSLSQPRYFCKTCRRYWTKGGTLRNIPVGGGCRKNKKVSTKKSNNINNNDPSQHNNNIQNHQPLLQPPGITTSYHHLNHNPKENHHLQLSFPDAQFSHISNLLGNPSFMLENNPRPIDFMESKLEGIIGSSNSRNNNFHFLGNGDNVGMGIGVGEINGGGIHHHHNGLLPPNFQNLCSPSGFGVMSSSFDGNNNNMMDSSSSCQRLMMLPFASEDPNNATIDVKPNPKLLSLEWQDQGCSDAGKDQSSFGYLNGLGSWTGMINGYGSSTTNPLV